MFHYVSLYMTILVIWDMTWDMTWDWLHSRLLQQTAEWCFTWNHVVICCDMLWIFQIANVCTSESPHHSDSSCLLVTHRCHGQGRARNLKGGQKERAKGRPGQGMAGHRRAANETSVFASLCQRTRVWLCMWTVKTKHIMSIDIMSWKVLEQIGHQTSSNIIKHHNATSTPPCLFTCKKALSGHGHADGQGPWPWRSCAEGMNGTGRDEQAAIRSLFWDGRKSAEKGPRNCQRDKRDKLITPLLAAMTYSEQINNDKHVLKNHEPFSLTQKAEAFFAARVFA